MKKKGQEYVVYAVVTQISDFKEYHFYFYYIGMIVLNDQTTVHH